jgi:hypothetical protein
MATIDRRLSFERPNGDPPVDWMSGRRYMDRRPLPALVHREWDLAPWRQEILLALYGEVCTASRALSDRRFTLLGLVPIVSLALVVTLISAGGGLGPAAQSALGVLGAFLVIAVRLYDLRTSQLGNDLVGRGRQIETELGIHTGQFRGRTEPRHWLLDHDTAVWLVYTLSTLCWVLAAVAPWLTRLGR